MYNRAKYDLPSDVVKVENYGKVIYLLGTAQYGGVNEPVKIKDEEHLKRIFGHYGSIVTAYRHISDISSELEIIAVKTTGSHAELKLNVNIHGQGVEPEAIIFRSIYANDLYNKISIEISNDYLVFSFPQELGGGKRAYAFSDYEMLGLLLKAINDDCRIGLNHVKAFTTVSQATTLYGALFPVNPDIIYMSDGADGIGYSKNELWYCLEQTYSLLESEYIDIVIPLEAYFDDIHPRHYYGEANFGEASTYAENRDYLDLMLGDIPATFHSQLLSFCKQQSAFGLITHGVMGFNRITDTGALQDKSLRYISKIARSSPAGSQIGFDHFGLTKKDRFFISTILGDLQYSDQEIDNGYIAYAGLLATINIADSTTNKPLGNNVALVHEFDTEVLKELANLGVTSFRNSVLKGLVVANGVTLAPSDDEMHYVCNVRMIQLVMAFVRLKLDRFLGEDIFFLEKEKVVDTELDILLNELKESNILKDFRVSTNIDHGQGKITIRLYLKSLYMVEFVETSAEQSFSTE